MAIVKPGSMPQNAKAEARAGITAADTDYNHADGDAIAGAGVKRMLVLAVKTAGGDANSTITVEVSPNMGGTFAKIGTPVALKSGEAAVFETYGRDVFLHVSALTAGTTWTLHAGVAEMFWTDPRHVS